MLNFHTINRPLNLGDLKTKHIPLLQMMPVLYPCSKATPSRRREVIMLSVVRQAFRVKQTSTSQQHCLSCRFWHGNVYASLAKLGYSCQSMLIS